MLLLVVFYSHLVLQSLLFLSEHTHSPSNTQSLNTHSIWMYAHIWYVCMHMGVCAIACGGRRLGVFLDQFPLYLSRQDLSSELTTIWPDWLAISENLPALCPQHYDHRHTQPCKRYTPTELSHQTCLALSFDTNLYLLLCKSDISGYSK